jgi:hypothetical protein
MPTPPEIYCKYYIGKSRNFSACVEMVIYESNHTVGGSFPQGGDVLMTVTEVLLLLTLIVEVIALLRK